MSSGKREKTLMIIILVLVIINSATLLIMWVNKPPFPPRPPHPGPPDKIIIERLALNENQQKQFETIRDEHRSQMKKLNDEADKIHQQYFELLTHSSINDSLADVYEKQLASIAEQREEYTFLHFKKLKSICVREQLPKYNDFIGELGEILSGPKPPPHH